MAGDRALSGPILGKWPAPGQTRFPAVCAPRVREAIKACPTPRRRSDLSPGPGSGASTASQTRLFASARRRTGGPGTSRAPCEAGFAKGSRGGSREPARPGNVAAAIVDAAAARGVEVGPLAPARRRREAAVLLSELSAPLLNLKASWVPQQPSSVSPYRSWS